MERHKCKLCLRTFANGRALGGHMRSHMLYRSGSVEVQQEETGSASLSLSSDEERESMCYGLRENPKRSIKLADPEFSFVEPVPVQDRESEAESAKNPVRRRSNRFRNPDRSMNSEPGQKRAKPGRYDKPEWSEPVSSVSDTTTEEDVAFCLMMMKRDKWMREKAPEDESEEEEDDDDVAEVEADYYQSDEEVKPKKMVKNKYKCETCDKVFKSYQALGGHRASHKRAKIANANNNYNNNYSYNNANGNGTNSGFVARAENEEKRHECPICFRVFLSGQALGGHKRSHVVGSSTPSIFIAPKQGIRIGEKALIDLNLPAPVEDEEDDDVYSQIELSAISEADFVINSNRH